MSKRILIIKEKHGNIYYDVETDELLHKTCCHILKQRLESGLYGSGNAVAEYEAIYDVDEMEASIAGMKEQDDDEIPSFGRVIKAEEERLFLVKRTIKLVEKQDDFVRRVREVLEWEYDAKAKDAIRSQARRLLAEHYSTKDKVKIDSLEIVG